METTYEDIYGLGKIIVEHHYDYKDIRVIADNGLLSYSVWKELVEVYGEVIQSGENSCLFSLNRDIFIAENTINSKGTWYKVATLVD